MRLILYYFIKLIVFVAVRIYFRRVVVVNGHTQRSGSTIYVSNHPASFMDPLVIGSQLSPRVYFLTRSDVFNRFTRPLLAAIQMLPIYRRRDGADFHEKNRRVFEKCSSLLTKGENLLIFGEGSTDLIFTRRLRPLKKGAARIGFETLVKNNWSHPVYISAIGLNYSAPNTFRSDVLISTSDEMICLNDYKSSYLKNPVQTINEVTKKIRHNLQSQLTHVENIDNTDLLEKVLERTGRGINCNSSGTLIERWNYSRRLGNRIDEYTSQNPSKLTEIGQRIDKFDERLKKHDIEPSHVFDQKRISRSVSLSLGWMFIPLGLLHFGLQYLLVKKHVERLFKRKDFWGSVKMIEGMIIMSLTNIPYIFLFHNMVYQSWIIAIVYYLCLPLFGVLTYNWFRNFDFVLRSRKSRSRMTSDLTEERNQLIKYLNGEFNIP